MVDIPAHVARQYVGNLGKIDNGVVSGTRLWADERVYYPLEIEPYTPESYFAKGKDDPDFRTKLKIALQLVQEALQERWPFRAVVADSFYGEDRGLRGGLRKLSVPYVMALKPSHDGRASTRRGGLAARGGTRGWMGEL
jgi:SRSO17 transposase